MGYVDTHNFLVVIYYLTKEKYILYSVNRLNKKLVKFEHEILELFQDLFSEKTTIVSFDQENVGLFSNFGTQNKKFHNQADITQYVLTLK